MDFTWNRDQGYASVFVACLFVSFAVIMYDGSVFGESSLAPTVEETSCKARQ
ncbi:hypothetical protein DPMN_087178 [Dreissena polymorpha]|uniref:Uncharacterized protein n=1 Tax=Dreissena polymorpha TaxID=45954 RepID=A0A9D4KRS1_DREPO|nr:hypothetical protein DPMN_087178 [Dreissena polymorpha]